MALARRFTLLAQRGVASSSGSSPVSAPAMVNLAKGHPDPKLLPFATMAEACTSASAAPTLRGLDYGSRPQGSISFLDSLADFISRHCPTEPPARPDGLLVTNGVSHGLDLVCTVFAKPGDCVVVEAPTYFLAVGIFQSHGLEVVTVPTDTGGLDVEALERLLDERAMLGQKPPTLLYTIPANHNPTGASLDARRRRALVALAQRRGFLILADEAYHLLDWRAPGLRPARFACFDGTYITPTSASDNAMGDEEPIHNSTSLGAIREKTGVVIAASSFTKIMAPGLRLGWLEAEPSLINRIASHGYLNSGGCVAPFTCTVVEQALRNEEADKVLAQFLQEYAKRADVLVGALESHGLDPLVKPQGGYFAWVPLPTLAKETLLKAEALGLRFLDGSRCDPSGGSLAFARLCFANLSADELQVGVARLAAAVSAFHTR